MTAPSLVVPLDASAHALAALPVAHRLAEILGCTIHLVHVGAQAATPGEVVERIGVSTVDLRGAVLRTKVGDPASGILDTASELHAELIVMCTHTAGPYVSGHPLGGTARAVLERAPCPVVLVRPERGTAPWDFRRMLLPHDGTPSTSGSIAPAVALARRAGAGIDVLHVASPSSHVRSERGALTPPRYVDQPQHEWPAWLGEFLERLGSVCPLASLDVRMWLGHGVPGEEVLRVAEQQDDDLIVVAWRGAWGDHHASTVKLVVERARAPVLVFRSAL